jgi:hypothetical protein
VGVSDGWLGFTGLIRLSAEQQRRTLADIGDLAK